jgi:tight adherence protein B
VLELRKQRGLNEEGQRDLLLGVALRPPRALRRHFQPRRWVMMIAAGDWAAAPSGLLLFHSQPLRSRWALAVVLRPLAYLKFRAGPRAKALGLQLPNALEVIVRSLEAGHPMPTAIALVGRELPDPIGSEFGMAADEIAYGATLEQAVARMADRCRHPDVDLFAATIRLQERAGGNLTGLLKMVARTVRERQQDAAEDQGRLVRGPDGDHPDRRADLRLRLMLTVMSPHFYGDVINERPSRSAWRSWAAGCSWEIW